MNLDVFNKTILVAKRLLAQEASVDGLVLVVTHAVPAQVSQIPEFFVAKLALMHCFHVVRLHVHCQVDFMFGFPAAYVALDRPFIVHDHVLGQLGLKQETAATNLTHATGWHILMLQQVEFQAVGHGECFWTLGTAEGFYTSVASLMYLQIGLKFVAFGAKVTLVQRRWPDHAVQKPEVGLQMTLAVELGATHFT